MSEVYFFEYKAGRDPLRGLEELFERAGFAELFGGGRKVALKLHMGERGNITYLRPVFARKAVDLVRRAGGNPFLCDTTVIYPGGRYTALDYLETAAANGFVPGSVGAPIIIADGPDGFQGRSFPLRKKIGEVPFDEMEVASGILAADAVLFLSHFKGHELSGIGGAIKQLAMGCTTKRGKAAQHSATSPKLREEKCTGCGVCVEECVWGALEMREGKPRKIPERCFNCSTCLFVCPQGAWEWEEDAREKFQRALAHAAWVVREALSGKNLAYINFVQDITPLCDCAAPAGRPVIADVGILASTDPVALDKASLDLVDRAPRLQDLGVDPPDILGKLHNTSSLIHIETAAALGLGSLEYELIEI